jgi:hypothetical protein
MKKHKLNVVIGLFLIVAVGACTPPAPSAPTLAVEPTTAATATIAAIATEEPTATAEPTVTEEPTATAEPAASSIPDVKSDPLGALLYATSGDAMQTAEFEYDMVMTMEPADEAAEEALGPAVDVLSGFTMTASGTGAMEIVDATALKNKMRMELDMEAAGEQIAFEMIMIEDTVWVRMGEDGEWEMAEADQAQPAIPGGMDPNDMMEAFADATDVEWVEDTELDGEAVSRLRFTVDPAKFDLGSLTRTLGEDATAEEVEALLKDMTIDAEVWLTTDELQLRQQRMVIGMIMSLGDEMDNPDARVRMNMNATMRLMNVNEPVTIEPPTE